MPTRRSAIIELREKLRSDAAKIAALEREVERLERLLRAERRARLEYKDLEVHEADDFDEDELGIDPEEGL